MNYPTGYTDIARRLLDQAAACLSDTAGGVPKNRYLYWGIPVVPCCDALVVTFTGAAVTTSALFPDAPPQPVGQSGSDEADHELTRAAEYLISVRRGGWPLDGTDINPDEYAKRFDILAQDTWAVDCCLRGKATNGDLFDGIHCVNTAWCDTPITFGDITTVEPSGECVGLNMPVTVLVDNEGCIPERPHARLD